jgi:2-polyprenyl-3-methyl-5-hydroxy-6-metoxy-1,4-benzoquinol methylase
MGWLVEKYTREYFIPRTADGRRLPYGVDGIEFWERGELYPPAKRLLRRLNFENARVLDIGPGRGEAMRYCLQQGAAHVAGIDFAAPAIEIARQTLQSFSAERHTLVHDDVLPHLQRTRGEATFRHILMLDVIEHIPRKEVDALLPLLFERLEPGGALVVHTPLFPEDDDVLVTGGKAASRDDSDDFEQTRGMHINRYSDESLGVALSASGFARWNDSIFVKPMAGRRVRRQRHAWAEWVAAKLARRSGFWFR